MKKNLTELVMILDRSGSMSGMEADTIGGYNSMLKKQAKNEGEVLVSTVLFDDYSEVIHDRVPIREIHPLTGEEYYPRGCTALLDALGGAIRHIKTVHRYAREEDRPEKTIFVITTDGMENSSKHYTFSRVKRMVEKRKEKDGWEFIFLGANIDAVQTAGRLGIMEDRAAQFHCDSKGTALNFESISEAVSEMRCSAAPISGNWKRKIERDFLGRKK